ncbi:MAG: hypothetical protein IT423_21710 [Pirellulaceae bacterium]|nr:hypothetical protein [Pirellulaceae bacterium]
MQSIASGEDWSTFSIRTTIIGVRQGSSMDRLRLYVSTFCVFGDFFAIRAGIPRLNQVSVGAIPEASMGEQASFVCQSLGARLEPKGKNAHPKRK